jgi:hypothetical protein
LTASQRAMIVAETLNIRQYKHGGDRRSQDWKGKAEDQDRPGGLEKSKITGLAGLDAGVA